MVSTITLVVVGAALATLYLFSKRTKPSHPYPPGPPQTVFLGNAREIPAVRKHLAFLEWAKKYGDVLYVSVFGRPIIILNSAKSAIDLLDKRSAIYSSRPHSHMADVMGYRSSTLLAPYGEEFRKSRKLLNTALNSRTAKTYWPIQEKEVHAYLARLLDSPKEFRDHVKRTSASIILKIAYGYSLRENDPFLPLVERATDSFGRAVGGGYYVDYLPILKRVPLIFWKADTRKFILEGRSLSTRIRDDLFNYTRDQMANGTAIPSFTSTLLEAKGTVTGDSNEEDLIKSAAAILYGAGSDTTAATIGAFLLAMSMNPDVQKKAQAELDSVIGPDRLPTWDDRSSLPYVDAVLKETLRWNTATPLGVPHAVIQDDVYEGKFIPAGSTVISNIWAIMRDESEFKNPDSFWPERFLQPNPPKDPHSYAFGFGRRSCPGMDVASGTVYMSLATTLQTFNISKAKDAAGNDIEPPVKWSTGLVAHALDYDAVITPRSEKAIELIRTANWSL